MIRNCSRSGHVGEIRISVLELVLDEESGSDSTGNTSSNTDKGDTGNGDRGGFAGFESRLGLGDFNVDVLFEVIEIGSEGFNSV